MHKNGLNGSDYNGHNLCRHEIVSIKPTTLALGQWLKYFIPHFRLFRMR